MRKKTKLYLSITALLALGIVTTLTTNQASANTNKLSNAYDISQWQGQLSNQQVAGVKHEVNFMILRAQAGNYQDSQFDRNAYLMKHNHIPYGAYSYSYYTSPSNAEIEAHNLYNRAPQANFYANDIEENDAGNTLNTSTYDWAQEMHHLTRKPVVLYSGNSFMTHNFTPRTLHDYNALWDAAYGPCPSSSYSAVNYMPYHYDLWQDSSNYYSPSLGQRVDADVFPPGHVKSLSFWTGGRRYSRRRIRHLGYRYRPRRNKIKHYVRHYVHRLRKPRVIYHKSKPRILRHRSASAVSNHVIYITAPVTNQVMNYGNTLVRQLNDRDNIQRGTAGYDYNKINHLLGQVNYIRNLDKREHYYRYYNNKHLAEITGALRYDLRRVKSINNYQNRTFDNYYRYYKIHYVRVRKPINIYSYYSGRKIANVSRWTHLYISYFRPLLLKRGWITQAVGWYHGHRAIFSSNKACLQWI